MTAVGAAVALSLSLVGCGKGEAKPADVSAAWQAYDAERGESVSSDRVVAPGGDLPEDASAKADGTPDGGAADGAKAEAAPADSAPAPAASETADAKPTCPAPGNEIDERTIAALGGAGQIFSVQEIPDDVFARMQGKSFKEDCTVPREDLRYLRTLYVNAEGKTFVGEMVVAASVADEVSDIFRQLYEAKWPIKRMVLVDEYGGSDEASCADGNTAAFNFRPVSGGTELSNHAFGLAIDINTFENPYCIPSQDYVFPPEAARFADRSIEEPYMIHEGDLCWRLFTERGWSWGGSWSSPKDYQHFEKV